MGLAKNQRFRTAGEGRKCQPRRNPALSCHQGKERNDDVTQPIIGLVGPSAAGKSTLILEMVRFFPSKVGIVKSLTTRPRRGPEDDLFYDFVTVEEMRRREKDGHLIQISEYAGNLYAHDRAHVDRLLTIKVGICALVEQGVMNLRAAGYDVRVITVTPVDGGVERDEARRVADASRAKQRLDAALAIQNSFAQGGLEKASRELSGYVLNLTR